jgi:DNA polymerase III subunit delta
MIRCLHAPTRYQRQTYLTTFLVAYPETDWDVIAIDALSTTIQDIIQEALTYTLLGKQRLLIVDNPYFLTTQRKPSLDQDQDFSSLEQLFQQTLDLPHILFVLEEPWDGKNKWVKLLKQTSDLVDLPPLKKMEWSQVIDRESKLRNLTMAYGPKSLFIDRLYPDLDRAMQELDKLALLGEPLTDQHIQSLIPLTLESNVFELSNALFSGKTNEAITIYQALMLQRVEPVTLLTLCARQLLLIVRVYALADEGLSQTAIANAMNIHEYRVKLMLQHKKMLPLQRVETAICSLADLDYHIKSGQIDRFQGMELWLLRF